MYCSRGARVSTWENRSEEKGKTEPLKLDFLQKSLYCKSTISFSIHYSWYFRIMRRGRISQLPACMSDKKKDSDNCRRQRDPSLMLAGKRALITPRMPRHFCRSALKEDVRKASLETTRAAETLSFKFPGGNLGSSSVSFVEPSF